MTPVGKLRLIHRNAAIAVCSKRYLAQCYRALVFLVVFNSPKKSDTRAKDHLEVGASREWVASSRIGEKLRKNEKILKKYANLRMLVHFSCKKACSLFYLPSKL